MINVFKSKIFTYYFLIFLLNILFTKQNYLSINLLAEINENDLNAFHFNKFSNDDSTICKEWIPSLFNPVLLVPEEVDVKGLEPLGDDNILCPVLSTSEYFDISLVKYKFYEKYNLIMAKGVYTEIVKECFFGLSTSLHNYTKINEGQTNLNMLKVDSSIEQKIFSFDKWTIKDDSITSTLYLGDEQEDFNSKNGIIGTCKTYNNDYWGCSFKTMVFNNNNIELKNDKDQFYKIYFSSENNYIIFPESFRNKFNNDTKNVCEEDKNTHFLFCKDIFKSKEYISMKLIDEEKIITTEIDNSNRFTQNIKDDQENKTRIKFENVNYFIFPLIIFKNFHIQFNSEKQIIKFYTTDHSILEFIKKDEDDIPKNDEGDNSSSNVGIVLLIIFIILLILVLGVGLFWYIKRKKSVEKNINRYNKFEDEENFQDMNEKRVF